MLTDFSGLFIHPYIEKQAVSDLLACNEESRAYGLVLSETEAAELTETRSHILKDNGRIELSGGVMVKLVKAFTPSPYLQQSQYLETLQELLDIFYTYKNETRDQIGDDDLIAIMKSRFNGCCSGSLELLRYREMEALSDRIRFGLPVYINGTREDEDQGESEDLYE